LSFFKDLNSKIIKIIEILESNQDLCKYLYYPNNDPLSEPNIDDTSILTMKNIFPLPKDTNAITDKISLINVYFQSSKPYRNNSGFREIYLCIDVMCHLDLWLIDEGIRAYCICNKIDEIFNNQHISDLSINNIYFENSQVSYYSDYYYGYKMVYKLSSESNVGDTYG